MAPDLKAVVLLRNVLAFCRSIMINVSFCEELKVKFCMPARIISNAKYGKINPMSYLSDDILTCEILDVVTIQITVCRMQCNRCSPEKEVKQYQTTSHHIPDSSRI
jgi:hypothetical protein